MYSPTQALIEWLISKGYDAYSYPPKDGAEFVTVERTGGGVADMVDHPIFAVQTWAKTEPRAEEMILEIREKLVTGDVPNGFYRVEQESYYPWWDESTRLARYQLSLICTSQLTK